MPSDVTLVLGDCLERMAELPDGSVDAVVADPPYAIPTQVASGRTITRSVGDLSIVEAAFRLHAREWKRVLGEKGRAFIFCDGASYSVIYRALYADFNLASLVWDKGQIGMGREFRKRHELIIHAWGADTDVTSSDGVGHADVIACKPVPSEMRHHPAEKPVELIRSLLRVCGDVILDPFMGGGSTGVACAEMGKQFVGMEIDPDTFATAERRIIRHHSSADHFPVSRHLADRQLSMPLLNGVLA